jgi:hypothetical protein
MAANFSHRFCLAAIFNIGYYSEIGLHFIGTADLTNFVYIVGLVFSLLALLIPPTLVFADWFLYFSRRAGIKSIRYFSVGLFPIVVVVFL